MTVRERVLTARLIEKIYKKPTLAKQMGLEVEQREDIYKSNKSEIRPADSLE